MQTSYPPPTRNSFRFLTHYLKQHWLSYTFGALAIFGTNAIAVSIPQYIQKSIDLIQDNLSAEQALLNEYLLIMLSLALGMIVVRTLSRILFFNPGRAIECQVKNDMFQHLMGLQKDYYDANPSGNIISRINNDINGIRMVCGFAMMQAFNIVVALSITPYKMWELAPELTLYCVLPILAAFTIVRLGMRVLVRNMRARMEFLQKLSGFTVASLSGIDVIKSYEMQGWTSERFESQNQEMVRRSLRIAWIRSFVMPVLSNLENILKLLILIIGGVVVIEQQMTIGELTAFISYAALLTMPLMALGWVTTMIQQGLVGIASVRTVFAQQRPFVDVPDLPAEEQTRLFERGGLRVQDLTYQYPDGEAQVLRNLNLHLRPGQVVGVLGRIGSGKSTLVNCLNRYLDPPEGSIFLGDREIRSLSFADVRRSIRTVTQEPFLFSDTVRENLAFSLPERDDPFSGKLPQLLRASALEDETRRFPSGTETLVGEKGIMLSGGQKQRISLGRAMSQPCDLLILDNVLSAVDYDTERFLLREIHELLRPQSGAAPLVKAMLIVSHRVTSMEQADHILVLDEGQVVDEGTHAELIQRPGYYQEMWRLQNESASEVTTPNSEPRFVPEESPPLREGAAGA